MTKIISIFIPILLILSNLYIYYATQKKIDVYKKNPPFFTIDFTMSGKKNKISSINHLVDNKSKTYWIKENKTVGDIDFEIELRLSHVYNNGYQKRDFKKHDK